MRKVVSILGTRGIPAHHGGFETFVELFSQYLHQNNWDVTVYCQKTRIGKIYHNEWNGIKRVNIPVPFSGAVGTLIFDFISVLYASKKQQPVLLLGYNTAIFCVIFRLCAVKCMINMDGVEWKRKKWRYWECLWLYTNEKLGAYLGNHLIADHPEIKKHLSTYVEPSKISVIPYSAHRINDPNHSKLAKLDIKIYGYTLVIARPEPENSILEIVQAYSRKKRDIPLIVLGEYNFESNKYHKEILRAASIEVRFVGTIYEKDFVYSLRYFARFYFHGHTVGGTNPSLVEALAANSAIIAHDNPYNRWVANNGALYFSTVNSCSEMITKLLGDFALVGRMKKNSQAQFYKKFTPEKVYSRYEELFLDI